MLVFGNVDIAVSCGLFLSRVHITHLVGICTSSTSNSRAGTSNHLLQPPSHACSWHVMPTHMVYVLMFTPCLPCALHADSVRPTCARFASLRSSSKALAPSAQS